MFSEAERARSTMSWGRPCHPVLSLDHPARFFKSRSKMAHPGAIFITVLLCITINIPVVHGQTSFCPTITVGGSNGNQGGPCFFPFNFNNVVYTACTTENNNGVPWCYTVQNGQNNDPWGECVYNCGSSTTTASTSTASTTTASSSTASSSTVTPTTASSSTASSTTLANTLNCPVFTQKGNAGGKACKFPFTYQGATYTACTKVRHDFLWCATTSSYDVDVEWGECMIYTNKNSAPCVFPFTVTTASNVVTYNECTTDFSSAGMSICGIQSSIIIGGPQMGFCQPEGHCPSVYPPTATTATTTVSTTLANVSPNTSPVQCSVPTVGGNSPPGSTCKFPFVFKGLTYNTCSADTWNQPWCATSTNFDNDKLYGNCVILTLSGAQCIFPFMYKGTEYRHCTGVDQVALWCATTFSFPGFSSGAWGHCDIRYEPRCGVPNTVPPGPICPTTYETVTNTISLQGTLKSAFNNLDLCRDGCTANSACVAFDFDFGFNECYFHDAQYKSMLRTTGVVNVNQYRKEPCAATSTVSGTGSACIDTFTRMQNTLSLKGQEQTNINTLTACQSACLNDQNCVAFDFDNNLRQCFKHVDGYLLYVQLIKAGVDQYRRIFCQSGSSPTPSGCVPTYMRFQNMKSFGGTESRGVVDVDGCKRVCTASPKCAAFDFDNTNLACYLHDTGYLNEADSNSAGVDQYRKDDSSCDDASDCSDTFRIFRNTLSQGGTILSGVTKSEDCMAECLKITDCAGFDFDLTLSQCFYHKAGFDKNIKTSADGVRDVHQYRRQECDDAKDDTTSRTSRKPQTTTSRLDSAKSCEYEKISSAHSLDGVPVEDVSSATKCESVCSSKVPPCPAFDFNKLINKCFAHTADYMSSVAYDMNNIDQYRLNKCECQNSYDIERNAFAYGGISQSGITQVSACTELCDKDITCVGFDFNRVLKGCFLHSAQTISQKDFGTSETDHYKKVPCNTDCEVSYETFSNTLSTGGILHQASTSVVSCERACTADSTCQAFDFNSIDDQCFLHKAGYEDRIKTEDNGVRDVNQYRRKSCDETSPQSTFPTSTFPTAAKTTVTTLPTTVPSTVPTVPTTTCNPTYVAQLAAMAEGGTFRASANTLASCRDACNQQSTCAGFDYYEVRMCYLHTTGSMLSMNYDRAGVINYKKLSCSTSIAPLTDTGDCNFKHYPGRMAYFGEGRALTSNINSCKNICLEDKSCKAVDFNIVQGTCFTHKSGFESFLAENQDVQQYVKECKDV